MCIWQTHRVKQRLSEGRSSLDLVLKAIQVSQLQKTISVALCLTRKSHTCLLAFAYKQRQVRLCEKDSCIQMPYRHMCTDGKITEVHCQGGGYPKQGQHNT